MNQEVVLEWSDNTYALVQRWEKLWSTALWHEPIREHVLPRHVKAAVKKVDQHLEWIRRNAAGYPLGEAWMTGVRRATDAVRTFSGKDAVSTDRIAQAVRDLARWANIAHRAVAIRYAPVPPNFVARLRRSGQRLSPARHPLVEALRPTGEGNWRSPLTEGQAEEVNALRQAECRQQYPTNHDDRPIEDWLLLTGDVRDGRWGAIATQILLRDQRAFALEGIIVIAGESIDVQWPLVIKPMDELLTVVPSVGELPAAVMKPACDAEPARGDPKPMDELLRIAQVKGLDPQHKPIGVLLAILHSEPRVGKTAFAWAGKKKGKVRGDTKRNLEVLEGRGLAKKNMATPPLWCLGEAAFPGNGDTHGDTHGDTKLP